MGCSCLCLLVPCEATGLEVDLQCETSSALLSWDASEGSVEYFGAAQSANGDMLYCDSTDTSCTILGLQCGGFYNFSVAASGHTCNSSFTEPLLSGAGEAYIYTLQYSTIHDKLKAPGPSQGCELILFGKMKSSLFFYFFLINGQTFLRGQ